MRLWPWSRRRPQPTADAVHAVQQAQRQLADVERLSCRIDEVADELHRIHERNHFGLAVTTAFRNKDLREA